MWIGWYGTSDRIRVLIRLDALDVDKLTEMAADEGPYLVWDLSKPTRTHLAVVLEGMWPHFVTDQHRVELLSSLEGVE